MPLVTGLLVFVVLARILPPKEFGVFAVALSIVTIASGTCTQWAAQGIARYLPARPWQASLLRAASISAWWAAAGAIGVSAIGWLAYSFFVVPDRPVSVLLAGVTGSAAVFAFQLVRVTVYQARREVVLYSWQQSLFHTARLIGATVTAVIQPTAGAALLGSASGSAAILGITAIRRQGPEICAYARKRSRAWLRRLWRFGAPFVIWSGLSIFLSLGSRIVTGVFMRPEDVAVFTVYHALASGLIGAMASPVLLLVHPESMRRWDTGDQKAGRRLMLQAVLGIAGATVILVSVSLVLGDSIIALAFGPEYAHEPNLLPQLLAAAGMWQIALLIQKPIEAMAKTWLLTGILAWSVLIFLIGNFHLLPRYGLSGAALALLVTFSCYNILILRIAGWVGPSLLTYGRAVLVGVTLLAGVAPFLNYALVGKSAFVLFVCFGILPAAVYHCWSDSSER